MTFMVNISIERFPAIEEWPWEIRPRDILLNVARGVTSCVLHVAGCIVVDGRSERKIV